MSNFIVSCGITDAKEFLHQLNRMKFGDGFVTKSFIIGGKSFSASSV
jgi:hypothetical protein